MIDAAVVFAKVDMNSPIDKATGRFLDEEKIEESAQTIKWCFDKGAHVVVAISHQGRSKEETLKSHVAILSKTLQKVVFCPNITELSEAVSKAEQGTTILLENIRNNDEEKEYSDITQTKLYQAVKEIAKGRKIVYVKDDLATCHRKDLSVYGLPKKLVEEGCEVIAGPHISDELKKVQEAKEKMKERRIVCLWGGAKLDDYLDVFSPFKKSYDNSIIIVTGPLSLLFWKARGVDIGENEKAFGIDDKLVEAAKQILHDCGLERIILPGDYYVEGPNGKTVTNIGNLNGFVVDIGPETVQYYKEILKRNPDSIIICNGSLGQYEREENIKGTREVYSEVFNGSNRNFVVGGGGDFNAAMKILKHEPHIKSSGGKAFLQLLAFNTLPGLEMLKR